jgi:hypothetical protein
VDCLPPVGFRDIYLGGNPPEEINHLHTSSLIMLETNIIKVNLNLCLASGQIEDNGPGSLKPKTSARAEVLLVQELVAYIYYILKLLIT